MRKPDFVEATKSFDLALFRLIFNFFGYYSVTINSTIFSAKM